MSDLFSQNPTVKIFLRRRQKLYKSLNYYNLPQQQSQNTIHHQNQQQRILLAHFLEFVVNKDNSISDIAYYIRHEFQCRVENYLDFLFQKLIQILEIRSGRIVAFVIYRLIRKQPTIFWPIFQKYKKELKSNTNKQDQLTVLLFDLYFYGLPLSFQDFNQLLFVRFQTNFLDLTIKYYPFLSTRQYFSQKNARQFHLDLEEQLIKKYDEINATRNKLIKKGKQIQRQHICNKLTEQFEQQYEKQYIQYQHLIIKFQAAQILISSQQILDNPQNIKSLFQLLKDLQHFKTKYHLPQYQQALYKESNKNNKQIRKLKKSEMQSIEDNINFIHQLKLCNNVAKCHDYASYFLEQMNTIKNKEELIQIVVRECHTFDNISYILKIITLISFQQTNVKLLCENKAIKICSHDKMNQKYQRMLCEMVKFNLVNQSILFGYIDRLLESNNFNVIREIQSLLENLGIIIYYKSIQTHIKMNSIFQKIQNKITKTGNIQQIFNLKCLLNYLRTCRVNQKKQTYYQEMIEIDIQQNFDFIKKKCLKILKEGHHERITKYIEQAISKAQYIKIYFYASLIKQLNNKEIDKNVFQKTKETIQNDINLDIQKCAIWCRFLGELYNYQIINRKKLLEFLESLLLNYNHDNFGNLIRCLSSVLEVSKYYLSESQFHKQNKQILKFLFKLKKQLLKNQQTLDIVIRCQIEEIMIYFHKDILKCLHTAEQIMQFQAFYKKFDTKFVDLYSIVTQMSQCKDIKQVVHFLNFYQSRNSNHQFKPGNGYRRNNSKSQTKKSLYKEKIVYKEKMQAQELEKKEGSQNEPRYKEVPKKIMKVMAKNKNSGKMQHRTIEINQKEKEK